MRTSSDRYGAQDLSAHDKGAYTGDVSGPMLAKLGCTYALVGHTERREYHAEDDAVVNAKAKAALRSGLTPDPVRRRGPGGPAGRRPLAHILAQLDGALAGITADKVAALVVAYEPVWAIGTGEVATAGGRAGGVPGDPEAACRASLATWPRRADPLRRLGEGVNVAAIMAKPAVDGALVGGASLDPDEFAAICRFRCTRPTSPDRPRTAGQPGRRSHGPRDVS